MIDDDHQYRVSFDITLKGGPCDGYFVRSCGCDELLMEFKLDVEPRVMPQIDFALYRRTPDGEYVYSPNPEQTHVGRRKLQHEPSYRRAPIDKDWRSAAELERT